MERLLSVTMYITLCVVLYWLLISLQKTVWKAMIIQTMEVVLVLVVLRVRNSEKSLKSSRVHSFDVV